MRCRSCELRSLRRRNPGHCRHCGQRSEGTAGGHRGSAAPRPVARIQYRNRKGHIKELTEMSAQEIREIGIRLAFVPEDRLGMGLVASMGMTDNMMLQAPTATATASSPSASQPRDAGRRPSWRSWKWSRPAWNTPVGRMSGGNVQKVLVGREIASIPAGADGGLSRARTGHQLLLYHLSPAQRAEKEGRPPLSAWARIWTCCWPCATGFWCWPTARSAAL